MRFTKISNFRFSAALSILGCLALLNACGGDSSNSPAPTASQEAVQNDGLPTPAPTPFDIATLSPAPTEAPPTVIPPTPVVVLHPESDTSYAIDLLLEGEEGVYGVVVIEPDGQISYVKNSRVPFISASLYKLILLVDMLRKVETGEIGIADELPLDPSYFPAAGEEPDSYFLADEAPPTVTVEEALFATGAYSSNVSAAALLSITNDESLANTVQMIGLEQTYIHASPPAIPGWPPPILADSTEGETLLAQQAAERSAQIEPTSLTTPMDMALYFQQMLNGTLIDAYVSQEVVAILEQQVVDDRFPYLLPPETPMAHKTGNLEQVTHDVGMIVTPRGQVILAAMTEETPNDDHATQIIQRLALIAYGEYNVPDFTEQAVMPVEEPGSPTAEDVPE